MLRPCPLLVLLLLAGSSPGLAAANFCNNSERADPAKLQSDLGRPSAELGLRLLRALPRDKDNASSPYSIATALAMTLIGARGPTAEEMARGLSRRGVPTGAQLKLEASLTRIMQCPTEYQTTKLFVADRLFVQKGAALAPDYLKTLKATFDATLGEVDYKKNPEAARKEINSWVESATQQKIKDLVPVKKVTPATRLVLVNAVYAHGNWKGAFSKEDTKPGDFFVTKAGPVKVPMMHAEGSLHSYNYAERPGYKAVEMPFADLRLSFVIILPDAVDGLSGLIDRLTGEDLEDLFKGFEARKVNLTLPKFKTESSFNLADALKSVGIKRAFDPAKADFSGIDGGKDQFFIGAVFHKAVVDVNEWGVEATAATAVMGTLGSAPQKPTKPLEFKADHPFLYAIVEPASGTVLFLGTLTKP